MSSFITSSDSVPRVFHRNPRPLTPATHQLLHCACAASCRTCSLLPFCPGSEMVLTLSACILLHFVFELAFHHFFQRLSVHVTREDAFIAARRVIAALPASILSAGSERSRSEASLLSCKNSSSYLLSSDSSAPRSTCPGSTCVFLSSQPQDLFWSSC